MGTIMLGTWAMQRQEETESLLSEKPIVEGKKGVHLFLRE